MRWGNRIRLGWLILSSFLSVIRFKEYINTQAKKGSNTNSQLNRFFVSIIVVKVITAGTTAQNSVESTKKFTPRFRIAPKLISADICISELEGRHSATIGTKLHFISGNK